MGKGHHETHYFIHYVLLKLIPYKEKKIKYHTIYIDVPFILATSHSNNQEVEAAPFIFMLK